MPVSDKIAVLMSTYNGEKYIKEQIDSILAQEDVDLDIYVQDDGSTDATIDIIQKYEASGQLKVISAGHNLGPGMNFMTLMFNVAALNKYDYYAFADQDDIWLPQKLKVAIEKLQGDKTFPSLYGSNRTIFENGQNKGLWLKADLNNSLKRRIHRAEVSGCTMVLNDALLRQVVSHGMPPAEIIDHRFHDGWIILVALVTGKFIYDPDSYILYRIHEGNFVGIRRPSFRERIDHLLKKGLRGTPRSNLRSKTAKLLLEYYPDMSDENKNILKKYSNYKASLQDKWALMSDKELLAAMDENPIIFGLKVLVNFV